MQGAKGEEEKGMEVVSLRARPDLLETFIRWFQQKWADQNSKMVYRDCMEHCVGSPSPLPQWYLLREEERILGGAGLIINDFISRGDLWPWLCALYIERDARGRGLGGRMIEHLCREAANLGFDRLYLCTDHVGYYERYGFSHMGTGYHPWGESSRIYERELQLRW